VRLQSVNSGTIIWEDIIYEGESGVFVPFSHGLWLDIDEIYELSAFAGAGVGITPGKTSLEPQSHNALFSFTATVTEGDPAHIYIAPDTISTRTKTITCYIWPPEGYDVTEIVQRTIRLDPEILPDRISVHSNQQMLVVKFPTAGLNLGPDPERVLTVTGVLTDGTRFEDSDIVEVVQRGGKPN
jgi:hypothetical protein